MLKKAGSMLSKCREFKVQLIIYYIGLNVAVQCGDVGVKVFVSCSLLPPKMACSLDDKIY